MKLAGCALCDAPGGRVVLDAPRWRLIHADEAGFPAFYRVVWQDHVREFSQLAASDRHALADVLVAIEDAMLRHLQPTKINVASLGNAVPHLHWHLIARFHWDSHFPSPVWSSPQRPVPGDRVQELAGKLPALERDLHAVLQHA